ncbi:MAG: trimethylamine methyltransferase family protein [Dehalococcoidales bacterium]|nr:MAG: trimethylamine methyltransferase family protein [Dehalococcoidales bacterium]
MARKGVLVVPYERLNREQIERVHRASMDILKDPGITCFNKDAAEIFAASGTEVTEIKTEGNPHWNLSIPEKVVMDAAENAPTAVKLGARNEENGLILDASQPIVHFASGSETNNWLEADIETFVNKKESSKEVNMPVFRSEKGNTERLAKAAHLCENLDSWDGFLRCVNIQDDDINDSNKDVNKFFISLNNTSKHVMAGLTDLDQLDNLMNMVHIIAGGQEKFRENPIISMITSLIKSPLQFVDDTTEKTIEIAKTGIPLVISSAPQGGSTAPIIETGIVAQINAEILAGITLTQLVNKGTPVLFGSVPGRANMADLHDSYGVPEFSQFNIDCVQMARYYGIPCYSSGGVTDVKVPGIQSTVERLFSQIMITLAGPQYLHYAFGLLERTSTFCPVQAVLDDAHISIIKRLASQPRITEESVNDVMNQMGKVMMSTTKLFTRFARTALRTGEIAPQYPFESREMTDDTILRAIGKTDEIMQRPRNHIDSDLIDKVYDKTPGLLTRLKNG